LEFAHSLYYGIRCIESQSADISAAKDILAVLNNQLQDIYRPPFEALANVVIEKDNLRVYLLNIL